MKKVRRYALIVTVALTLAGAAVLSGCVAVPGPGGSGYSYGEPVYSAPYYGYGGSSAPVYAAPPSVYIEGETYYQRLGYGYRRPYGSPYYNGPQSVYRPDSGYAPRPGYSRSPDDRADREPRRGDPRASGPAPSPGARPPNQQPGAQMPGARGAPPSPPPRNGPPPQVTRPPGVPKLERSETNERP